MSNTDPNLRYTTTTDQGQSLIPPSLLHKITLQAETLATHSWEHGTVFHALLQLYDPDLSIFSDSADLHGNRDSEQTRKDGGASATSAATGTDYDHVRALKYIKPFINTSEEKCEELFYDPNGAAGDPPSLGIAALMIGGEEYVRAVDRQLKFLLTKVPRWGKEDGKETAPGHGAISHRKNVAELWADMVFMVPPFLAYVGAMKGDVTLGREAVTQIKAYREVLLRTSNVVSAGRGEEGDTGKAWMHIVGPENEDLGFWSTSNGWVALGIASVIAILRKWPESSESGAVVDDISTLIRFAEELISGIISIDGAIKALPKLDTASWDPRDEVLLRNYIDEQTWFPEVAGTAGIAAAVYRIAVIARLHPNHNASFHRYREWAEEKYRAIALNYIDHQTGLVTPVVNALNHRDRTPLSSGTAEAQCFVLMLEAARRDYYSFEEKGETYL